MNQGTITAILVVTFLAVYCQATVGVFRHWTGAQPDLLPPLMVYAGLSTGLTMLTVVAVCGGLLFDSLSANPLGSSILPLFLIGFVLNRNREVVLRDHAFAQFVLGLLASAANPLLALAVLFGLGQQPLVGWMTLWQWFVMAITGALLTPLLFRLFDRLNHALNHPRMVESSAFRHDREIKRGKI